MKILSGSDKGEHTYIKMYPTDAPMNTKLEEAVSLLEDEDFQGAITMLSEIITNKKSYDAYMLCVCFKPNKFLSMLKIYFI